MRTIKIKDYFPHNIVHGSKHLSISYFPATKFAVLFHRRCNVNSCPLGGALPQAGRRSAPLGWHFGAESSHPSYPECKVRRRHLGSSVEPRSRLTWRQATHLPAEPTPRPPPLGRREQDHHPSPTATLSSAPPPPPTTTGCLDRRVGSHACEEETCLICKSARLGEEAAASEAPPWQRRSCTPR